MEKVHVAFTSEELKNLGVFLSRVQLTGAEVGAFQDVVRAVSIPVQLPDQKRGVSNKDNGKLDS